MPLETGDRLGPYTIVSPLGAGGMGEVYLAIDTRLERQVALKILPASGANHELGANAIREARLASTLAHPNVCTVFEAGEIDGRPFIAMERVDGQSLAAIIRDGPLPQDRAVRLGSQIADGLAHAHERGIVHRDLKPANVIVTPDGRAKIVDFGVARRGVAETDAAAEPTRTADASPSVAGTWPYVAPEVLRGEPADARSDLWALGIVLFEMVAGRRPFDGRTAFELTSAILSAPSAPLPPHVPRGLQAIIQRCLAKPIGERYQRAAEVKAALDAVAWSGAATPAAHALPRQRRRAIGAAIAVVALILAVAAWAGWRSRSARAGTAARPAIRTIAVLPLANLSGDSTQDYFADGMTEALITDLARVKGIDVISRTSVMQYRAARKPLPQIARELSADAIVEGSVLRAGDRVRITAQLIEAASDRHLWADEYDRDARDILTLQREVARAIAREVRVTLAPQDEAQLAAVRRIDPTAHEAFLKAQTYSARLTEEDLKRAIALFQQAIDREPRWADPWAGLAFAHLERGIWGVASTKDVVANARAAITRALDLDPKLGEAHRTLGSIAMQYDWDWTRAEREMRQAIELSGGDALAHREYATMLHAIGRFPEALAEIDLAGRLDPLSASMRSQVARIHYRARRFDDAIRLFHESIELDRTYLPNYARLADVYIALAKPDEAIDVLERGRALGYDSRRQSDGFGVALAMAGRRQDAIQIADDLKRRAATSDQPYYSIAMVETALGDYDEAIAWLTRAVDERTAAVWLAGCELKLDPLRRDARFLALLRRINIPQP